MEMWLESFLRLAMSFPVWAPATLVEEYERLRTKVANCQELVSGEHENSWLFDDLSAADQAEYKEKTLKLEELACVLYRLLSNPDMKSAWATLSRPIADPQPWKNDPALMLWNDVSRALRDFPLLMEDAQSPVQYRKSLLSIATKAKALQASIARSSAAKVHAQDLVADYLRLKNLEYREALGETPLASEYHLPLTMFGDSNEALGINEVKWCENNQGFIDDYEWRNMSLVWRLRYWVIEAGVGTAQRAARTTRLCCKKM